MDIGSTEVQITAVHLKAIPEVKIVKQSKIRSVELLSVLAHEQVDDKMNKVIIFTMPTTQCRQMFEIWVLSLIHSATL